MIKRLSLLQVRLAGVALLLALHSVAAGHEPALPDATSDPAATTAATLPSVEVPVPAALGSLAPNFASSADGIVVMSWLEPADEGFALRYSRWSGSTWSAAATVAQGENWFVNWADFPSVVPITEKFWVAHWLVRRPAGGYAYDISLAVSNDGGKSWGEPFHPHRDDTDTEHGFVSIYPAGKGAAGLVWLDGRNTATKTGGMTLRSALLSAEGALHNEMEIDDLTCDCCQTDALPGSDGALVAYRDRTSDEIRDIYVSKGNGSAWTDGNAVANDGWEIGGCPVNGPTLAARDDVTVIAWFTAANDRPRVRFSRSTDGGDTFSPPVDVVVGGTLGRVGVAIAPDGSAAVSALTRNAEKSVQVTLTRLTADGKPGAPLLLADGVHPFSVPQLTVHGDALLAAWTVREGDATSIRSAIIPLTTLYAAGVNSTGF